MCASKVRQVSKGFILTAFTLQTAKILKSLLVPIIIAGASILSFLAGGYVSQATPLYTAIYLVSLGLAIWFSAKLPAKGLIIFAISSFAIAVAVEPTMTAVGLWKYAFSGEISLLYPIFSYSVLLLLMLLLAKVLDEILKRYRERIVSMVLVPIAVAALSIVLMQVEGYLALLSLSAILIYSLLLLLSLYYVIHQPSRWNIALLLSSIITAASMEVSVLNGDPAVSTCSLGPQRVGGARVVPYPRCGSRLINPSNPAFKNSSDTVSANSQSTRVAYSDSAADRRMELSLVRGTDPRLRASSKSDGGLCGTGEDRYRDSPRLHGGAGHRPPHGV